MKKAWLTIGIILLLSAGGFSIMYFVVGWTLKKSVLVAGGAGTAMIIFDVLVPIWRGKRNDFV